MTETGPVSTATAGPRKRGLFYGWWIVICASISGCYHGAAFIYGFTTFFNPIVEEFGWSRAITSGAFSLYRLEGGIGAPVAGFLVDRMGPRKLILFGMPLAGTGFILLSRANSVLFFYAAILLTSIGFSAATGTTQASCIGRWFVRKRARALSFYYAGNGAGGMLGPALVWLITSFGWRQTLVILGLGFYALTVPLALVMRRDPESYGYLPDGGRQAQTGAAGAAGVPPPVFEEFQLSARQALRTPSLWLLGTFILLTVTISNAIFVHEMPFFIDAGFTPQVGAAILSGMALGSIAGRLGFAWLGDCFQKRYVMAIMAAMQAVGVFFLAYTTTLWQAALFIVFFGPAYGGCIVLRVAIQGELFGRQSFGTILGLMMGFAALGGVTGPIFAGWIFDITGGYRTALNILAWLSLACVPLALAIRPVNKAKAVAANTPSL